MNNITSEKEKVNLETIKNDKIIKLPWIPNLGPKMKVHFAVHIKMNVLKNFANFTGKHLRQRLFFNKVAGLHQQVFSPEK